MKTAIIYFNGIEVTRIVFNEVKSIINEDGYFLQSEFFLNKEYVGFFPKDYAYSIKKYIE